MSNDKLIAHLTLYIYFTFTLLFFYFYNSNIFDIIDINNNYNNKTTENQLVMLCRFYFCNDTVVSVIVH